MSQLTHIQAGGIPAAPKDAVAFWDLMAAQFARGSVASQIMCGFALIELKKEMGIKPGNPTQNQFTKSFVNWPEFVEQTYGFSHDTARNRVKMAEGVRAKFKRLDLGSRFKALLQTHPSEWSESDTKLISDALHNATSGMSQADFFNQLGLATGASGNPDAKGKGSRKLTMEEQRVKAIELALEDSGFMGNAITASNRNFFLLAADNDVEIEAQISVLEFALRLRHKYRNTPRAKRNDALIAEIQKLIASESPLKPA